MSSQPAVEAIDLVRASGDDWARSIIFSYLAATAMIGGEAIASRAAAEEGRDLADAVGDQFVSRGCRAWLGVALWALGDLADAARKRDLLAQQTGGLGFVSPKYSPPLPRLVAGWGRKQHLYCRFDAHRVS